MATNDIIAALREERRGYELYGRDDRAAQVDAELARLGVTESDNAGPAKPKRATKKADR